MTEAQQRTIETPVEAEGIGLHTGAAVRLRLLPGDPGSGVRFRRTDLENASEIPALVGYVAGTDRGTTVAAGDARVHTVEHLLSAVAACGIDNLVIELDEAEPPAGDGSARLFVQLLERAGSVRQEARVRTINVDDGFSLQEGSASYVVAPARGYHITTTIEFDHPLIGRQTGSFEVESEEFEREIAPARTFGFVHEVEALRERGLARGGTMNNALVLTDQGQLNEEPLRFPDEFVRHKTLDLIGDLALIGARLQGHVVADRPSHRGNVALARELVRRAEEHATAEQARPVLTIQQILQYLPHRYPFLLVDRVVEYEERKRIVGIKNVTINEPFFVGHFPGHPTMPGVLIIEAMAQVGGLLMLDTIDNPEDKIVYFMTLDNVKWRRPVIPGDQIRFELEVLKIRNQTCRMRGVGTVDGQVVAEAEMMARVVDR